MIRPICLAVLVAAVETHAATLNFTLLTDSSYINYYPGKDNLVGTADDVISPNQAGPNFSAPNTPGALSFWTVRFFGSIADPAEFNNDVIRFQSGSMTLNAVFESSTRISIVITGGTLTGTEAFTGGGPSTATLGELGGGSPDELILNLTARQIEGPLDVSVSTPSNGGLFQYFDQVFSATGAVVPSDLFGHAGNSYVDSVLTPLAEARNATALFVAQFHFTLPPSGDGLNQAQIVGTFAATTTDPLPLLPTATPSPTPIGGVPTPTPTPTPTPASADLDGNGTVDAKDLILLLDQLDSTPGP